MQKLRNRIAQLALTARNQTSALSGDERGASFIEYVIVVGLVAIVCIGAFTGFGNAIIGRINAESATVGGINTAAGAVPAH